MRIELIGTIPTGDPNVVQEVYVCCGQEAIKCEYPSPPEHHVPAGEEFIETKFFAPADKDRGRWGHRKLCRRHGAEFEVKARPR